MSTSTRLEAVGRGLGSLLLIVTLLVVPPLLLAVGIGWPLPTALPSSDAFEHALRLGPDDRVIVNALAIVAWIVWAQVAVSLVVEIISAARGQARVHLPLLPGTQALAGRLAAGLMLLAVLQPSTALASGDAAASSAVGLVVDLESRPDLQIAPAVEPDAVWPAAPPSMPTPAPTITVQRHDTYWAIAERTLGDGTRWRQIHDLNVGRTMVDGHIIASSSDLLRPGWILELPAQTTTAVTPTVESEAPSGPPAEVVVEPGDHLWGIAADVVETRLGRAPTDAEVAPLWQELIDTNRHHLAHPDNPSLIHPGQVMSIPAPAGPEPLTQSETDTPTVEAPSESPHVEPPVEPVEPALDPAPEEAAPGVEPPRAGVASAPDESLDEASDDSSEHVGVVAVGGIASAALAVGVTGAVRRRRRRYLRDNPGRLHQGTPTDDVPTHRSAVANSDPKSIDDLRGALGALADAVAAAGGSARPRIVQHSAEHLDLYLAAPDLSPPDGWQAQADGAIWTLDRTDALVSSRTCVAPLLVTLGQPDEDGQLYLDLEADGLVSLVGDPDAARGLARSFLTELSLGPLTDTIQILVVGDLVDISATALDHVSLADTWDEITPNLIDWMEGSHAALEANAWPNTFVARGADEYHDALAPLLVIAAKAPPGELGAMISAHRPAAVAVVVADEIDCAGTVIDCQGDLLTVLDIGLSCVPQDLADDTFASIMRVLIAAESPDDEASPETDLDDDVDVVTEMPTERRGDEDEPPAEFVIPEYEVLVRVLGDIRVDGFELSPKHTAALAFIALHRSVSVESLEEACWSNLGDTARPRMRDALSEIRRTIGSNHLPQAVTGRYEVRSTVMTDAELFDRLVEHAALLQPEEAVERYREALGLITGKVFTYPGRAAAAYSWIDTENLVSRWELKIAGVALQCIETCLELDDPASAVEIANETLGPLPLHRQITESLMRAHAASGDIAAVDVVYQAHAEGLRTTVELEPEESTDLLREQLTEPSPR
jgi:nucleoid-associated protein YgaU/DNA-binding SARP family transcriptional activator